MLKINLIFIIFLFPKVYWFIIKPTSSFSLILIFLQKIMYNMFVILKHHQYLNLNFPNLSLQILFLSLIYMLLFYDSIFNKNKLELKLFQIFQKQLQNHLLLNVLFLPSTKNNLIRYFLCLLLAAYS